MKKYTPIIILALIAVGVGIYLYRKQKATATAAAAAPNANITAVPGGTGMAPDQEAVPVRTKMAVVG